MTRVQRRHRQELDLFLVPECVLRLIWSFFIFAISFRAAIGGKFLQVDRHCAGRMGGCCSIYSHVLRKQHAAPMSGCRVGDGLR